MKLRSSHKMDDERIREFLRDLPREEASPYFTTGVLRRLREARPSRRPVRRLALAASAAVVLVAGVLGGRDYFERRAEEKARRTAIARLESLEVRKSALEQEIRSLRRLARDARPVVYLGSTPNLDVVVNLERLAERRRQGRLGTPDQRSRIRPASHSDAAAARFASSQPTGENRR